MNLVCLGTQNIQNNSSWRIPLGLFYVVPFIVIAGLYWVPESPRWLLVRGRREEAHVNLSKLRQGKRSDEQIAVELAAIEIALREEPEQGRFREIWQRQNVKRTLIAAGINFFQELSGQQITAKFGALIVADIGNVDPFIITVIYSVIGIITVSAVMVLSDRFGRRPFLLASIATMCLAATSLGAVGVYDWEAMPSLAAAAIFCLVLLSFGFSLGYAPLTNVVMTEVVSLRLRDMSIRTAGMMRVISNFIVGLTLPYELNAIGLKLGFIYGAICFVAFIFTYFCVPECKGKSLEVIEYMFHTDVPIRRFGSYKHNLESLGDDGAPIEEYASNKGEVSKEKAEGKH